MAKLKFKGIDEYVAQLQKLQNMSDESIGRAVYAGAAVVADAVKQAIRDLPVDERAAKDGDMLQGISRIQKAGLIDGFGIAPLRNENGYMHVKLGFDGYNGVKTKSYPQGQPNSVIARSINSGTSFRQRIPFMDQTVLNNKDRCERKMQETFDKELQKLT